MDSKILILEKAVLREKEKGSTAAIIWFLNLLLSNWSLHVFEAHGN